MSGDDGKYKGTGRRGPRHGMGRLRRAAESAKGRQKGWERHAEDEDFLDREETSRGRATHLGESLLARFNRVARAIADAPADALPGRICGFAGRQVIARLDDGREIPCDIRTALLKQFHGVRNPLVVGDQVRVTLADEVGVVEAVGERRNVLARADSHNKALLHQLAANLDHLVIVCTVTQPDFKPGFLDRALVLAEANDIPAAVVFNKSDLAADATLVARYADLGYPVFTTCAAVETDPGIDALREHLRGHTAAFTGQSGVGKTSLLNALYPGLGLRVGRVSNETGKGRHTTTGARSIALADDGELIDTPGIRECGVTGLDAIDVALLYRDLARFHHACHFNDCTHRHEPDCAVRAAVERGDIAVERYHSYCAIVAEDLGLA